MATNKYAVIRYNALDQCFRNPGRRYFIQDLIKCCSEAIYDFSGNEEGVKRRQIFEDIKFMESDQGWSIPLERHNEGKKVYYRYSDLSFSIKSQPLNHTEANQLKETLMLLGRFKGLPQFEWMDEMLVRLQTTFRFSEKSTEIVGFDQNRYLKGLEFFSEVFNAILYTKVLSIKYKSFKQHSVSELTFHPYYLKQYNNRWFLFGLSQEFGLISNLALDRIEGITELNLPYAPNLTVDFEEFFEDAIGVTVPKDTLPQIITLKINSTLWPYIETKPIHGSQRIIQKGEGFVLIELFVIINYELVSLLFSMGEELVVTEPSALSDLIKGKAKAILKNYS
ncbi:helix-turn-helix transcriptional regulator [Rufibacter tibetensis]|uniref:Transcriptional regulator n=1 Tax=Rufibacter tibetensis TaxID=512763 RepID=A0A0N7HW87_9BACT|nr:WYL domain-containing protein [Rufibacter tibetensis]ALI98560.1 transcriptional regulator [Rufibacter tibetensis]